MTRFLPGGVPCRRQSGIGRSTTNQLGQDVIDAFTTGLNNLDGMFTTPIFGKMINLSSKIDIITGSANPGVTNKMRMQ